MSKKYVCLYKFGSFSKGDPYKGSDRDTAKLIKNGMICPLMQDGGSAEKKPQTKTAPQIVTNLTDEQLAEEKAIKKAEKKAKKKAKADLNK